MTLVPMANVQPALTTPIGMNPLPDDENVKAAPAPGIGDTILSALRTTNTPSSYIAHKIDMAGTTNEVEPGYNPWKDIVGTPYEEHWNSFVESNNPRYTARLKATIDRQNDDRRTLAGAGWMGTAAQIMAGVIDPTILIPVGGEIAAGGKTAWTIGKGALVGARTAGTGAAIQEGLLHSTQETRTAQESEFAIGGSIVLGSLLGGGAAALMSRPEQEAAQAAFAKLNAQPGSIGAAATEKASLEDLTVSGKTANALAAATRAISPNLRANFRLSPAARQYSQELAENTLYQSMHEEGRSLGAAVETQARSQADARLADAVAAHEEIWKAAKKAGLDMSRPDFEEAVGRAMRRGDEDPNPFIAQAAKMWRDKMFDAFKDQAIQQGLLPDDVDVTTARSYFSRVWDREQLTAREGDFKDIVTNFYGQKLAQDFADGLKTHQARVGSLDQELADLKLSPEDRANTLDQIDQRLTAMEAERPDLGELDAGIGMSRRAAMRARQSGDAAAEKAARDQIERYRAQGGDDLAAYSKEKSALQARSKRVDLNYAGLQERADQIETSIAATVESNDRALNQLIARAKRLDRDMQRADPEKLQSMISDLRTSFYDLIERSNKAQDRTAKAIAGLGENGAAEAVTRLEKLHAAEAVRTERLNSISRRLEAAESLDPHATRAEIEQALNEAVEQASDVALKRGEKLQRLRDRLTRLDPKRLDERVKAIEELKARLDREFADRWEIQRLGQGIEKGNADFTTAARDIADEVFDKLTGRGATSTASALPEYLTPITRGPLKERTFNIPDRLVESFLHSNVRHVGERYARTMAAEIELTRRFGRADMRDQLKQIADEYRALRDDAIANIPDEGKRAKKLKELADDEKGALEDIQAMRDLVRGTYKSVDNASNYGRLVRALTTFNYLRTMGGVVISSLSDLYRPAMVHGLGRYMSEGIAPLMTNIKGIKLSVAEAKLAGQVTERVLQHRMMSLGELGDPYGRGTAVERLLQNGSRWATKWNGLALWTDAMKSISSVLSQNRLLDAAIGGKDERLLAYLGVDRDMSERIAKQFAEHGETIDNVKVARTQDWTDEEAVRAYRGAVAKDVASIIVTPSVADVPLFAKTPTGRLIMQFRNFTFSAHQRMTLRAMQEGKAQMLSALIGMTALGMMTATLRSWRGGKERFEKFEESASNPGYLIGEGLDSSGLFALPIEIGNTTEKLAQSAGFNFNPIKTPMLAAGQLANPDASMQGESTRFASRGPWGALFGPSVGFVEDSFRTAATAHKALNGDEISKGDKKAAIGLVPYNSYVGMREMMQLMATDDSPYTDGQ